MDMREYLDATRHAVEHTIGLVWAEHHRATEIITRIMALEAHLRREQQAIEYLAQSEDMDDALLATARFWNAYDNEDAERIQQGHELEKVMETLEATSFSRSALSAAILQIAKQGISVVHHGKNDAPEGRAIGRTSLREVVWEGRNHALHWEEGNPRAAVVQCFEALIPAFPDFAAFRERSFAFDVVCALGWTDYARFETDLMSLGGATP